MHEKLLMGAEKVRICKEEVVTYLEVQTRQLPGETEDRVKNI
jgi:hypothetical protein